MVTGGAGFIGSHLCEKLLEDGNEVLCVDNFFTGTRQNIVKLLDIYNVEAKKRNDNEVVVWGTGDVSREFLYVEDAARGIVRSLLNYNKPEPVNLGTGEEIKIKDLIKFVKDLVGYKGNLVWDDSKPDGLQRMLSEK